MDRDFIGYGGADVHVRWPGDARIAISLIVHFEEGAERSPLYGDTLSEGWDPESMSEGVSSEGAERDLQVESLWEFGPRTGFWRLLRVFDDCGVNATFFCSGQALERNPRAAAEIGARGHEVAAQGYRWIPYDTLSLEEEQEQHRLALSSIQSMTGVRPVGWHSRFPSLHTRQLLVAEGGFLYDSDSYGDDLPHVVSVGSSKILTIPYPFDLSDRKFSPVPGTTGFTRPGSFFAALSGAFDRLYEEGASQPLMMSVALRTRISGRPGRASEVEEFIRYAAQRDGVWFARRMDIARHWL